MGIDRYHPWKTHVNGSSGGICPTSSTLSVPILATALLDGKMIIWEHYPDNTDDYEYDITNENLENNSYFEVIAQLEGHGNEIKCLAWNATGTRPFGYVSVIYPAPLAVVRRHLITPCWTIMKRTKENLNVWRYCMATRWTSSR